MPKAQQEQAEAALEAARSSVEVFRLNLHFGRVTSPIDGQVSRYYLTLGNLVNQDQTLLTTVVSLDPMYAYFDVDEPTVLRVRRAINDGRIKPSQDGLIAVHMGLQGENGFPHQGNIDFINNQVNPSTGSISVRGVFPNSKPQHGVRLLSPGMFVRIRLPIGQRTRQRWLSTGPWLGPGPEICLRSGYRGKVQYRASRRARSSGRAPWWRTSGRRAVVIGGLQVKPGQDPARRGGHAVVRQAADGCK